MALATISPVMQQRLAVAVPLIALGISLLAVYPAWGRYRDLGAEVTRQQEQLDTLKATPIPPPGRVEPAAARSPEEPPQFLGLLRQLANDSRCRISGFNVAPSGVKSEQIVRAVRASIELDCRYPQLRSFLYHTEQADRVLTVTDVKVVAPSNAAQPLSTYGLLKATIGIERYMTTSETP